ncbi:MAG: type II toxin-antitoxin system HipA family toxin, partial [Coriobacteriales bacterium]|nr:type II toxin-antitoxin system HipA family toxin [Coriobacteriales bacterium]
MKQGYKPTRSIEVRCWNEKVGALALDPETGFYAFQYYPDFAQRGLQIAPLTMPLDPARVFIFPNLPVATFSRLPSCIADSLPDAFGNALIDSWMAAHGVQRDRVSVLDRLAYLGNRAMGALEFVPPLQQGEPVPSALQMNELVAQARRATTVDLHGDSPQAAAHVKTSLSAEAYPELSQLIAVGTSAGGARAKAVVGYNPSADRFISGQFELPEGYRHWLIKFDTADVDNTGHDPEYGRVEYAYATMARDCGILMSPCQLYEAAGRAHFMTQRFDRVTGGPGAPVVEEGEAPPASGKLHIQTLCAMAELDFNQVGTHDYSQLFLTIERLGLGYQAIDQAFTRMVFNVCMANCDDHTKNHSLMMDAQGQWRLAPAYDLTHAYRADSYWVSRHLMSVNGRFASITAADLLQVARRFNVSDPIGIIQNIRAVAAHWPDYAKAAGASAATTRRVRGDIEYFSGL